MEAYPRWQSVEPLKRFGDGRHRRAISTDSGKSRKLPALPYMYWCKSCGNVVRIVMMTTRNVKEAQDPQRYMDFEKRRQIRAGSFLWEYEDAKAFQSNLVGSMNKPEWEVWREKEAVRRRKIHDDRAAMVRGNAFASDAEKRLIEAQAMSQAAVGIAMREISEGMSKALREVGKGRSGG